MPSRKDRIKIAAELELDPFTVDKFWRSPEKLKLTTRRAIEAELVRRGLAPAPAEPVTP